MPEPPRSSEPDQLTAKLVEVVVAGSGLTLLVGGPASMVTRSCLVRSIPWVGSLSLTWSVEIAALVSKVTRATLRIWVPVGRPALGWMM